MIAPLHEAIGMRSQPHGFALGSVVLSRAQANYGKSRAEPACGVELRRRTLQAWTPHV